jgi:hypothetical protein
LLENAHVIYQEMLRKDSIESNRAGELSADGKVEAEANVHHATWVSQDLPNVGQHISIFAPAAMQGMCAAVEVS